jgi:hypothetical protein
MNRKFWMAAAALMASLYTAAASAEIVIGVKGGTADFDVAGSDPAVNASVQLAFDIFDIGIADIAVEGEYSTSLSEGEIDLGDVVGVQELSFESTGLYLSLRTVGPVYVIVRAGYAKNEIEFENGGTVDDSGTSTGVGVGLSMGLRTEVEYTTHKIEDLDINYLTLGFAF